MHSSPKQILNRQEFLKAVFDGKSIPDAPIKKKSTPRIIRRPDLKSIRMKLFEELVSLKEENEEKIHAIIQNHFLKETRLINNPSAYIREETLLEKRNRPEKSE